MPIYEYECEECGHKFEETNSIKDRDTAECEKCGEDADLIPSGGHFIINIP